MTLHGDYNPTGDNGGEVNVGVGSSVDNAAAPVSPLSSAPRLLDFRCGRGIALYTKSGFQS